MFELEGFDDKLYWAGNKIKLIHYSSMRRRITSLNPDQLNYLRQGSKGATQPTNNQLANTAPPQRLDLTKRSELDESKSGITAALSQ